jgi:hypothetical protein
MPYSRFLELVAKRHRNQLTLSEKQELDEFLYGDDPRAILEVFTDPQYAEGLKDVADAMESTPGL